jgi:hypothetical protein
MRAYIMIVALLALAIFALVYTARTQDRTYAGFNCTVDCKGHEAGYRWALTTKTIAQLAIPSPFMKAVSPMFRGSRRPLTITASGPKCP